jgi:hypothetical protein
LKGGKIKTFHLQHGSILRKGVRVNKRKKTGKGLILGKNKTRDEREGEALRIEGRQYFSLLFRKVANKS